MIYPTMRCNTWIPSVFNELLNAEISPRMNMSTPAINILENDNEYVMELAAAAMKREDFEININNEGNLSIKMEKKSVENESDKALHYLRKEFSFAKYSRTIILPKNVDKEKISAKMEDGILTINLPKIVEEKAKMARQIFVN